MICLQVENLTKQFGNQKVVDNLSFELQQNTATALIGPNGAGKTTTLSMLTGLLNPSNGTVLMPDVKDIRKAIGFLPQYPQYFTWMTALEYVEMAARLSEVPAKEAKLKSQKMLEFVGLGDALGKKTVTFSGGMKQRLGIAQALVHEPKLVLLDEPVSALDPVGRREIMNLLKDIQQKTTILYSTHILNDAEEMTDQVLFLRAGQLVEQGSLTDVRARYDEPRYKIEFRSAREAQKFADIQGLKTQVRNNTAYVDLIDESPSMQQLLVHLTENQFDVTRVERVTTSLEEIFMKVAQKG